MIGCNLSTLASIDHVAFSNLERFREADSDDSDGSVNILRSESRTLPAICSSQAIFDVERESCGDVERNSSTHVSDFWQQQAADYHNTAAPLPPISSSGWKGQECQQQ